MLSLASDESQAFDGLAGDIGDELIILVEMEDGELRELSDGSVQPMGDRGSPVLAPVSQGGFNGQCSILDRGRQVLDRHAKRLP